MASTCDSCGSRSRERPHRTPTGRAVCTACHENLLGSAAGLMAGGGAGGAVATAGWFRRIRDLRRRAAR